MLPNKNYKAQVRYCESQCVSFYLFLDNAKKNIYTVLLLTVQTFSTVIPS